MALKKKRTNAQYRNIAKRLSRYSPDLKTISQKTTLTANDKRKITRLEHNAYKAAGSGVSDHNTRILVPISEREVRKLKDKSMLVPGLNAIVQRDMAPNARGIVRGGELYIKENGKLIGFIPVNFADQNNVIDTVEKIFGEKKQKQVWVHFQQGRGGEAYHSKEALYRFITKIYEQYLPRWENEGFQADDIVLGFDVYYGRKPPKTSKPKSHKKKPVRHRKTKKPTRKRTSKTTVQRVVQYRMTETRAQREAERNLQRAIKRQRKATADLLKAARAQTRAVSKPPRKRKSTRGTRKKNRRH